nr:MAG TPA: hypothetical protein [Bacteriophage sp.]DAV54674.1 MAG TPA: hypothetical protein [Caudoviricetes sp.]
MKEKHSGVFLMILKKFRSLPEEYGLKILHRLCL